MTPGIFSRYTISENGPRSSVLAGNVRFFAYTRSWVCADLWPALRELAAEPNMVLFLSCDHSMADNVMPPWAADLPWAWLAVNGQRPAGPSRRPCLPKPSPNAAPPRGSKLLHTPVCSAEDGKTETTCRECRFCWQWKQRQQDGTWRLGSHPPSIWRIAATRMGAFSERYCPSWLSRTPMQPRAWADGCWRKMLSRLLRRGIQRAVRGCLLGGTACLHLGHAGA